MSTYHIEHRVQLGDWGRPSGAPQITTWYLMPSVTLSDPHYFEGMCPITPRDGTPAVTYPNRCRVYFDDIPPDETSVERLSRHYGKALASLPVMTERQRIEDALARKGMTLVGIEHDDIDDRTLMIRRGDFAVRFEVEGRDWPIDDEWMKMLVSEADHAFVEAGSVDAAPTSQAVPPSPAKPPCS